MNKKALILSAATGLTLAAGLAFINTTNAGKILGARYLTTESTLRNFDLPEKTQWRPEGPRQVSSNPDINAQQAMFGRALHTDTHGTDEVGAVVAPAFEKAWHAEANMFVTEGPVFDSAGHVYFSPVFPPEKVIAISLDGETGERRWVLPGFDAGAGTPLIIQDPDTHEDLVIVGSYDRAVALTTDGDIIWDVATGLPKLTPQNIKSDKHSFGINYHIQADALIAVMGDGHLYVLDRKTGRSLLQEPFMLPGDRLPITNFSLPNWVQEQADQDIAHMVGHRNVDSDESPVASVLHAAAGELQKVTNFFSIDSNSGRIWVAATLPDADDGKVDGWSEKAAVYGLDLVKQGDYYTVEINAVANVPGGTASTPAISPDGSRIYVADAYDSVYAIDTKTGEHIWKINVTDKVAGSINIASDNGELYANTRTHIRQLFDRGDHAELGWVADLDMYNTGLFQENIKSLGAEITANGVAFTGAAGVVSGKQKFPLKLGAGLIDRKTGKVRYFAEGAEDSVSSMVTGPKGSLYVGNSPLRRVLGRVILGKDKSPQAVVGGITKFKPIHINLLMRDALWAAATRAENAAQWVESHPQSVKADLTQIRGLIQQARDSAVDAISEGSLSESNWRELEHSIATVEAQLKASEGSLTFASKRLKNAADRLDTKI